MRWAVTVVALAACRYTHGVLGGGDDVMLDDARLDTRMISDGTADVTPDMPGPPPPYCDAMNGALVACYQFENNTSDSSANGLHATMTNVSFPTGRVGQAMLFGATSAADVGDSIKFDVSALTIEAWVKPSMLPTSGRMGILDMNGQYGLFIHPGGNLGCTIVGGVSMNVTASITTTEWRHVACTYDGSTTNLYSNGTLIATGTGGGTLATGGNTGISLAADNPPGAGSQLIGLIDEVRFLSVARTGPQICADAGQSVCP